MAWVEVEESGEPWVLAAAVVGPVFGAVAWWQHDFCTGLFAYLGVGIAILLARDLWNQAMLPREARRAAKRVLAWFRERFPEELVEGVAVRAIQADRYVIAVRHGFGMPTPRSYFAISRSMLADITPLLDAEWWPRGLK